MSFSVVLRMVARASHASSILRGAPRALRALVCAVVAVVALAPAAHAAGSPDITMAIDSPTAVLQGESATVQLSATNPAGQPFAYNLSYRVVLPQGIAYAAGSASGGLGAPQILANSPAAGQTTLLFANVSDLSPNSTNTGSFGVTHDPVFFPVGTSFTLTGGAYVNSDPRYLPKFAANGTPSPAAPDPTSYTGFATGLDATLINAVEIRKSEPSSEGELLRGIHDHQTTYTLTYRNNGIRPTTNVAIDDYLPASLEFLGCGGAGSDHTTNAPTNPGSAEEYPGSGPVVVPTVAGCTAPSLVETVNFATDPDGAGPLAAGVYTHVRWTGIGTLAAGASATISYRAAIPLRANTMTFTGGTPATTGLQATNLDNNSGPEATDEQPLVNVARIAGNYDGVTAVTDEHSITRTAEDLAIRKSVSSGVLAQGALTTWTLVLRASEYRYSTAITVTDTLPDGLCPLGAANFTHVPQDGADAECAPVGGQTPSAPYTTATEGTDGSWQLVWNSTTDPALAQLARSTTHTITFPTRTRANYQENYGNASPILAGDAITNSVGTGGTQRVVCAGGPADCSGAGAPIDHDGALARPVADGSGAGQQAGEPTIDKQVAQASTTCALGADTYVTTVPTYRPGDRVCWKLRVDFPGALDTRGLVLTDFLPTNVLYDATLNGGTGQVVTANDTLPGTTLDNTTDITPGTPGGQLRWTLPAGGVVDPSEVFERAFATTVGLPLGTAAGDIKSNLFKTASQNTQGVTYPLRDAADYALSLPSVALTKRITQLNGGPVGPTQTQAVAGGDVATFRVRLTNSGTIDAERAEVWDNLPAGITCADVSLISDSGACSAGRITWGASPAFGPTVPFATPNNFYDLTYRVTVPTTVTPTQALTNTAGVRQFSTPTNQGGRFTYVPQTNIDPTQEASANVPAARDTATLSARALTIVKGRTSPVDGTNNTAARAAVGEIVHYTITLTVPRGETVNDMVVTDPSLPDARQPLVAGSTTATLNGGALPGGVTFAETGSTPSLTFPATYNASAGADDVFRLEFDVRVADVAANVRGGTNLSNTGRVTYDNPSGTPTPLPSAAVTTAVVAPAIAALKANDTGGAPVIGNQIVTYTVSARNGAAGTPSSPAGNANISPAHDSTLVDTVPSGLTPLEATGTNAVADGGTTGGGGVWNATTRRITFPVSTPLEAGSTQAFTYRARVNDPATGGTALQNSVTATTTSLAGAVAGERTAASTTNTGHTATTTNTLSVQTSSIAKGADRTTGTTGDRIEYYVDVTLPGQVQFYDTTVRDVLPDAVDFDAYGTATCITGCPPESAPTVQTYTPVTSGGTVTVAWDLGDLAPTTATRVIRLRYRGHIRFDHRGLGTGVIGGNAFVNSATVGSNRSNLRTFDPAVIPPVGSLQDTSAAASHTITVIEPGLSLDKQLAIAAGAYGDGPSTVRAGEALHYRLIVRNPGNAPLYDVTVRDTPDAELTGVTLTTNAALSTDGWTAGSPGMEWLIPGPIAPGDTVTLGYDAGLVAMSGLRDGQTIDNSATVPSAFGVPGAQRAADNFTYRTYATGPDTTRAVVDVPTLSLVKTTGAPGNPDSAPAQVGQAFPWRVVVTNTSGTATATALDVRDVLPRDWTYVAASASFAPGGAAEPVVTAQPTGDELRWTTAFTLAPGASTTLTFQARPLLASATSIGTGAGSPHVNRAQATVQDTAGNSGDADGPFASGSDPASAILSIPVLTVAKTPDGGAATAGTTVPWHVVVTNTGSVGATDVDVTDTFPAGATYVAGSATAAPSAGFSETAASAAGATWRIASLAAGASVDITVPLAVAPSAASGATLTNSASAVAAQTPSPVTDTGTVTLNTRADLVASKSAAPNPATAGQTLTYTIGAQNLGPSDAQSVTLTDTLPATVTFVSASPGCTQAGGVVTCAIGTLTPTQTETLTVTVTVNAGVTTNADNTVTVASPTTDPVPGNDTASATVPVGTRHDVSIEKTALDPSILHGATGRFRLVVRNAGPSTATSVTVSDPLPAGLAYVSDDGGCAQAGGTVSCAIGTLLPGADTTIEVVVRGTATGAQVNTATVSSAGGPAAETDPSNDASSATITVLDAIGLALVKSGPATVTAGGTATYDLTVTNAGPEDGTGVYVDDTLPAGTTLETADAGCAATSAAGVDPVVVRCLVGALASGDSATRQLTVRVPIALGDTALTNTATTRGDQGELDLSDNDAAAVTQVGPAADLALTKTAPASVEAGGQLTWTMVVTNKGPSAATNVVLDDPLPAGGFTIAGSAASQGTCGPATGSGATGDGLHCELGTLAVGDAVQVTLTVTVPEALGGTSVTNTATAGGAEPDVDPANDTASATTTLTPKPPLTASLEITKVADGPGRVGQRLGYTITVTNKGPAESPGTVVTDALSGSVRFEEATTEQGTCAQADGTVTCRLGTLANGQTVKSRVIVTVLRAGPLPNTATVSGPRVDRTLNDNAAVAQVQAQQSRTQLRVDKWLVQRRLIAGHKAAFRIKVRNTGTVEATDLEICDVLPRALTLRSARGGSVRGSRFCFELDRLAPGRRKVFLVKVVVSRTTDQAKLRNQATATAANARGATTTDVRTLHRDARPVRTTGVTG